MVFDARATSISQRVVSSVHCKVCPGPRVAVDVRMKLVIRGSGGAGGSPHGLPNELYKQTIKLSDYRYIKQAAKSIVNLVNSIDRLEIVNLPTPSPLLR